MNGEILIVNPFVNFCDGYLCTGMMSFPNYS